MTDKNKVFDTIVSFFRSKLGILTVIGSIVIGLDSFLGSILNFPEHYEKFKNDYVYDLSFFKWYLEYKHRLCCRS